MQIDYVINGVNVKSTFQMMAFLILSFPTFQNYFQFQNILLAIITPDFKCTDEFLDEGWIVSKSQCILTKNFSTEVCSKWNFSPEPVGITMVSEFSLVCDKSYYGELLMIVWYLTSLTSPIAGWLADHYGRKTVTVMYLTLETICSVMIAFSSSFFINMVLRFFLGISSSGLVIAWVWLMESVNIEFRDFIGSYFFMYGCLAYMISPLNTYMTQNWRTSQLISILPSIFYVFIWYIPESPRWLLSTGNRRGAFNSIKHIASINKLKINFKLENITLIKENKSTNFKQALKSSVFIHRSLMAVLLQFSNSLFYSAVAINLTILNHNIYVSMFLLGLMETPSLFISFLSLRYQKRKHALLSFGGIGSILFLLSTFFNNAVYWQSIVRLIIGCIAKTAICCVNQTSMTYAIELFPTSHRSSCVVWSQLFNFLSFIGAIYINKLSSSYFFLPMTIYMFFLGISCVLAYYTLPETKGLPFPETIQDQEMLVMNREDEFIKYMKGKYTSKDNSHYLKTHFLSDIDEEILCIHNSNRYRKDYSVLTI